jgi:hypothetical protein
VVHSSTSIMEAARSSETSLNYYRTAQRYISEDIVFVLSLALEAIREAPARRVGAGYKCLSKSAGSRANKLMLVSVCPE